MSTQFMMFIHYLISSLSEYLLMFFSLKNQVFNLSLILGDIYSGLESFVNLSSIYPFIYLYMNVIHFTEAQWDLFCAFRILFKKSFPTSRSCQNFPIIYLNTLLFYISHLDIRFFLKYFWCTVWGKESMFVFLQRQVWWFLHYLLKISSFLTEFHWCLCPNSNWIEFSIIFYYSITYLLPLKGM